MAEEFFAIGPRLLWRPISHCANGSEMSSKSARPALARTRGAGRVFDVTAPLRVRLNMLATSVAPGSRSGPARSNLVC